MTASPAPSQMLSRKSNGNGTVTANSAAAADPSKTDKPKGGMEGQKVIIRRLPPGLTEDEFNKIIGDEWQPGSSKVSWGSYKPGKVSRDPSKPAIPSRASVYVKRSTDLPALVDIVNAASWEDAKETWTSPSLVGPPVVELAVYKKVPKGKCRADPRQGTIDQDEEFMDFLEGIANPAGGRADEAQQASDEEMKAGKATTTPLIDYLREKKAAKAKEAASSAKGSKHSRQDSHGGKGKAISTDEPKRKGRESKSDKPAKPKETVKILTKKAAADAVEAAKLAASQIVASREEAPKSRRAGIAAAARILQRDLGLSPGNAHRRARQQAAAAQVESEAKAGSSKDAPSSSSGAAAPASPTTSAGPSTPTTSKAQTQASSSRSSRGKKNTSGGDTSKAKALVDKNEPAPPAPTKILLKRRDDTPTAGAAAASSSASTSASTQSPSVAKNASSRGQAAASGDKAAAASTSSSATTRAFVKHANTSQGVTEALLREAMEAFGSVTSVEVDRRKGFAYVDFATHDALVKAMAASPVAVAQASVQVMERKEREAKKPVAPATAAAGTGAGQNSPATESTPRGKGPAAEKSGTSAEAKRGGRRRGGRGRGEGPAKEATGGGSSKTGQAGGSAGQPSAAGADGG